MQCTCIEHVYMYTACVHVLEVNVLSLSLSLSLSSFLSLPLDCTYSMVSDHCTLQLKERTHKRSHKRVSSQGDDPDTCINMPLNFSTDLTIPQRHRQTSESQRSPNSVGSQKSPSSGASASTADVSTLFKVGSHNNVSQQDEATPTSVEPAKL